MSLPEPFRTPTYVAAQLEIDRETAVRLMSSQQIVSRDIAQPAAKRRRWRTTDSAIRYYQASTELVDDNGKVYEVVVPSNVVGVTRAEYDARKQRAKAIAQQTKSPRGTANSHRGLANT